MFDATNLHGPTDLVEGWLVHAGDDPAYALPKFNDSKWIPFDTQTDDLGKLLSGQPNVVWYRLHLKTGPEPNSLALLANPGARAMEVYSDGVKLISVGRVAPYEAASLGAELLKRIPSDQTAAGDVVIAVRVYIDSFLWQIPNPGLMSGTLLLGREDGMREHMWYMVFGRHAIDWLDDLIELSMLLGALLLYSTQRHRREYLWLFCWMLVQIPSNLLGLLGLFYAFPNSWNIVQAIAWLGAYPMARMYCAFVGCRVGWKLNLYIIVSTCLASVWILGSYFTFVTGKLLVLAILPFAVLQLIVLPYVMLSQFHRGTRAEIVLLVPLLLSGLFTFADFGTLLIMQIPKFSGFFWKLLPHILGTAVGPFYFFTPTVTDILSMFSLALITLIHTNRVSRQQALLEGEMANAKEIQRVILPEAIESIPGFRIESVYHPAREVGGDFFQIVPVDERGMLVVTGDVAGKGLPAAMMVSVLVGAIRTAIKFEQSPDALLAELNERIMGRTNGGFSTALAALIASDGSVHIANAGHLPPYLNGKEIDLPPALPLGIVGDAQYAVIQLRLDPGDRMTFYTDGVIEAQNNSRELFGFDRGREVSTQSASAIAEAAKAFGQEDDITVIAIQRIAEGEQIERKGIGPALVPIPA